MKKKLMLVAMVLLSARIAGGAEKKYSFSLQPTIRGVGFKLSFAGPKQPEVVRPAETWARATVFYLPPPPLDKKALQKVINGMLLRRPSVIERKPYGTIRVLEIKALK